MKQSLFIVFLFFGLYAQAQKLLQQEVSEDIKINYELFKQNVFSLTDEKLDSIDVEIFTQPQFIGLFLVEYLNTDKKPTYGNLYKAMLEMKDKMGENYEDSKLIVLEMFRFMSKIPISGQWETDRKLFMDFGTSPEMMKLNDSLVPIYTDGTRTYKEIFDILSAEYEDEYFFADLQFEEILEEYVPIDIDFLLKECSQNEVPLIIYVSGNNSVNSRNFENKYFKNHDILELLYDYFTVVNAIVDDNELLSPEMFRTEILNGEVFEIKTYGNHNFYEIYTRFNVSDTPVMIFFDFKGEILQELRFTDELSSDEFIEALELVLNELYSDE